MILNTIPCCRKCFINSNETLYLEIRNNYAFFIYMSIEYKINDKTIIKQSPVFKPGTFERLTFPSNIPYVYFKVFDVSRRPPELICSQFISPISSCYSITGESPSTISCVQVPC